MKDAKENTTTVKTAAVAVIAAIMLICTVYAGDLEPSAPPAAGGTMKTLDEVEPRVPVNDDTAPGNAYYEYVISSAGSYYLTGDVNTTKGGIQITANNVTLDLCGYSLIGNGTGAYSGLDMDSESNVEIRNGTVRNFAQYGVMQNYVSSTNHRVINIRAVENGEIGIYVHGINNLVKDCISSGSGSSGFYLPGNSTVTGCKAYDNSNYGLFIGNGSVVRDNTAYVNSSTGIYVSSACTVIGNTARSNSGIGIQTGAGCTVQNNTACENDNYGIRTGEGCTVTGNTARGNTDQGGIFIDDESTVIGNTATDNDGWGLYCSQNCLVDQNTAVDNTNNMYSYNCTVGTNHAP